MMVTFKAAQDTGKGLSRLYTGVTMVSPGAPKGKLTDID